MDAGSCGDGVPQAALGEECDEGEQNGQEGADCTADCKWVKLPECGDSILDILTELCDAGSQNGDYPGAPCRANCMLPYCGDGILDPNEECDDGNNLDGDNCNLDCTLFSGAAPIQGALIPPGGGMSSVGGPGGGVSSEGGEGGLPSGQPDIRTIPTPARTPTGPGLVIFLASGAAAGIGLARRRLFRGK